MSTTEPGCCEEFARAAGLGRRGFLRGLAAVGGAATVTAVHGTAFTSTAYAAAPVDRVLVLLSMRGRLRRAQPGGAARRPRLLRGSALHPGAVDEAAGQGRLLRPAPRAGAAAAVVDRRVDGRRARHRAARAEPLALLGDGGARGRRPRLLGPRRLAQPAGRAERHRHPDRGHPVRRRRADHGAGRPRAGAGHHRRGLGQPLRLLGRRLGGEAACLAGEAVGRRGRSTRGRRPQRVRGGRGVPAGPGRVSHPGQRRDVPRQLGPGQRPGGRGAHHPCRRRGRGDRRRPRVVGPPHLDRVTRLREPAPDGRRVRAQPRGVPHRPGDRWPRRSPWSRSASSAAG